MMLKPHKGCDLRTETLMSYRAVLGLVSREISLVPGIKPPGLVGPASGPEASP